MPDTAATPGRSAQVPETRGDQGPETEQNAPDLGPCICTDLGPCRGDPEDGPFDCEPCKQLLDITEACLNEPGAWPWTQ
jgi:hypothetical protein